MARSNAAVPTAKINALFKFRNLSSSILLFIRFLYMSYVNPLDAISSCESAEEIDAAIIPINMSPLNGEYRTLLIR